MFPSPSPRVFCFFFPSMCICIFVRFPPNFRVFFCSCMHLHPCKHPSQFSRVFLSWVHLNHCAFPSHFPHVFSLAYFCIAPRILSCAPLFTDARYFIFHLHLRKVYDWKFVTYCGIKIPIIFYSLPQWTISSNFVIIFNHKVTQPQLYFNISCVITEIINRNMKQLF